MNRHTESEALVREWLDHLLNVKNKSWRTVSRYQWCLIGAATSRGGVPLLAFMDGAPVWELTHARLVEWLRLPVRDRRQGERPPSDSTMANKSAAVKMFFTWLRDAKGHQVDYNLLAYTPQFFDEESDQLTLAGPKPVPDLVWRALWRGDLDPADRLWVGQGYFLGMRVGEIANMRPENVVDGKEGHARFIRKGGKYASVRYRSIVEQDLAPYLPHLGPFEEWLVMFEDVARRRYETGETFLSQQTVGEKYPHPVTGRIEMRARMADITWYNKRLRALLKANQIPQDEFTPHRLRHSAGTNLWRAGVTRPRIMDIMNHGKFETTAGYAEVSKEFDDERRRNQHEADWDRRDD